MFKHLENLRNKPEHTRRKILVSSVCVIMFFIVAVWALSFPARFGLLKNTEGKKSNTPSPFFVLSGYIEEFSGKMEQSANSLKSVFSE